LPPETERQLVACAAANGQDVAPFAIQAIEEKIKARASGPIDQLLEPLQAGISESGLSDEDLTSLLKQARDEARREKRQQKAS
jgi:hypothetical protein